MHLGEKLIMLPTFKIVAVILMVRDVWVGGEGSGSVANLASTSDGVFREKFCLQGCKFWGIYLAAMGNI